MSHRLPSPRAPCALQTLNQLTLRDPVILKQGLTRDDVVMISALAAKRTGQMDAIDKVITEELNKLPVQSNIVNKEYVTEKFVPFNANTKRCITYIRRPDGTRFKVRRGGRKRQAALRVGRCHHHRCHHHPLRCAVLALTCFRVGPSPRALLLACSAGREGCPSGRPAPRPQLREDKGRLRRDRGGPRRPRLPCAGHFGLRGSHRRRRGG